MIDSRRCPSAAGPVTVKPVAVRPTVCQRGRHPLDDLAIGRLAGTIHESSNAAHDSMAVATCIVKVESVR